MIRKGLALVLAPLVLLSPPALADVLTVDDDGPANFSTIQDAIDAAENGDVILIQPGQYTAFNLTKRLDLIGVPGPSRPFVSGKSIVSGPSFFDLSTLQLDELLVQNIAGRGRVDDCGINQSLMVHDSVSIELSRIEVDFGTTEVRSSEVSIVDCQLIGAAGGSAFSCGYSGDTALELTDGSFAWIAGSTLRGGDGGWGGAPCCDGHGGDGVLLAQSEAIIRGRDRDLLEGGDADEFYCGMPGAAVNALAGSRVVVSGVTVGFGGLDADLSSAILTDPNGEPWIRVAGTDGVGGVRLVEMFGVSGSPAVLTASPAAAVTAFPAFEAPVWLNVSAIFFTQSFTLGGFASPVTIPVPIADPLPLLGIEVEFQAVYPAQASLFAPGTTVISNPATLAFQY